MTTNTETNTETNPRIHLGANGGPPIIDPSAVMSEIDDLFDEAKNWADGEPIASAEIAAAMTKLYDDLHDAGKRCDELRIAEKKPLDDQIEDIQSRYNPYVQPKKGKVALGKQALGDLLTTWRAAVAKKAADEAAAKRLEAERIAAEAQAAFRASAGNREAREQAEELLKDAKEANRWASRAEKKATTGTGLRTVWVTTVTDDASALDWAFGKAPEQFLALALSLAEAEVRVGKRNIDGFSIVETKVAT